MVPGKSCWGADMNSTLSKGAIGLRLNDKRVRYPHPTVVQTVSNIASGAAVHEMVSSRSSDQEGLALHDDAFKRDGLRFQDSAFATREEWLEKAIDALAKRVFIPAGCPLPPIKVAIGFPSGKGVSKKRRVVGQCWPRKASDDGLNQVFLNPTLTSAEQFVDVLAHELVHAVDDCRSGHKGEFLTIRKSVGLTKGIPSAASAGPELLATIDEVCRGLGPLPHATLHTVDNEKKQGTRLLKVECFACGYTCRITAKWVELGLPICPCGLKMVATSSGQMLLRNRNVLNGGNHEKLDD